MPRTKKAKIFIDLDGTILDVSERVYRVYKDILKKQNKKYLSKNKYFKLKREKTPLKEILAKTKAESILSKFEKEWERRIEDPNYLNLDKITFAKKKTLLTLKNHYKLVLITLRSHPKRLFNQLKKKKIDKIFDNVLALSEKAQIKKYGKLNKDSIIIGDTETDILAGKHLGIKTVAIISGMRSRNFLKRYKPDVLIKDFSQIENLLNR